MIKEEELSMKYLVFSVFFMVVLGFSYRPAEAQTYLSREEATELFVGKAWHGPTGVFLFRTDNTYTFMEFDSKRKGTWSYQILSDGTFNGNSTTYRFFKRNNGEYGYRHGRSNRNYRAIPNMTAPFQ